MNMFFEILDILSKAATIAVPLVTLWQINKNLIETNKPFILLSDGKVENRGFILNNIEKNTETNKISYLFCFNTWSEFKDKEKEPYIVNIELNNAGNGLVKNIKFYRIRDIINKEFVVMTEKINNVYNYGIRINKNKNKKFCFEASKGYNYYVIVYSDIYDKRYYNILNVYVADSEDKHKIIMKTYKEFMKDEKLLFKSDEKERIKEKQDIENTRNSIKKIVRFIKWNKELRFNCTYNA